MKTLVALTYTRVRAVSAVPAFLRLSIESVRTALETPGNKGVRIKARTPLSWYTMTAWEDEGAMVELVRSDAHRKAIRATRRLTTATRFERTTIEGPLSTQSWRDVYARLGPPSGEESPSAIRTKVKVSR